MTEDKMYNAFWRHALFVRGQSFSVKTYDRSRNRCQVIGEGAGDDFRGPSVQALPLPSRVSFSRAGFFLCPLLPSACYAGYKLLNDDVNSESESSCDSKISHSTSWSGAKVVHSNKKRRMQRQNLNVPKNGLESKIS